MPHAPDLIRNDVYGNVVAPDDDNRVEYLFLIHQEFGFDLFILGNAFGKRWDAQNSFRPGECGNGTRRPGQGRGNKAISHFPDINPQEFFNAQL